MYSTYISCGQKLFASCDVVCGVQCQYFMVFQWDVM